MHSSSNSVRKVLLIANQETELLRGCMVFLNSPSDREKVEPGLPIVSVPQLYHANRQNVTNKTHNISNNEQMHIQ